MASKIVSIIETLLLLVAVILFDVSICTKYWLVGDADPVDMDKFVTGKNVTGRNDFVNKTSNISFIHNYTIFNFTHIYLKTSVYYGLTSVYQEMELNTSPKLEYEETFDYDEMKKGFVHSDLHEDFDDMVKDFGRMYGCLCAATVFTTLAAIMAITKAFNQESEWMKAMFLNTLFICSWAIMLAVIGLALYPRMESTTEDLGDMKYQEFLNSTPIHGNPLFNISFDLLQDYSLFVCIAAVAFLFIGTLVTGLEFLFYTKSK